MLFCYYIKWYKRRDAVENQNAEKASASILCYIVFKFVLKLSPMSWRGG